MKRDARIGCLLYFVVFTQCAITGWTRRCMVNFASQEYQGPNSCYRKSILLRYPVSCLFLQPGNARTNQINTGITIGPKLKLSLADKSKKESVRYVR